MAKNNIIQSRVNDKTMKIIIEICEKEEISISEFLRLSILKNIQDFESNRDI